MIWCDTLLWQINPAFREQAVRLIEELAQERPDPEHSTAAPQLELSRFMEWSDLPVELLHDVAIVRVTGPLVRRSWWRSATYERLTAAFQRLLEADDIKAVIVVFDSPGGTCAGLKECAAALDQLSDEKLTIAQVDGGCYSAAYYLACYCGSIHCGATDHIGNIGTVSSLDDYSKFYADHGVRSVTKKTGPIKGLGIFGDPITPLQEDFLQHLVDQHFTHFREAVMTGRQMNDEEFAAVSDGRWWLGEEAVSNRIIDRVSTLSETLNAVRSELSLAA